MNIKDLLNSAANLLNRADIPSARLDAEVLLLRAINADKSYLFTHPEAGVAEEVEAVFHLMIERRAKREPVAYIVGEKEFYSLPFRVTPDTLIPRPETETLVDCALELYGADQMLRVLDIGAGSGAIAVAIAYNRPGWRMTAVDKSDAALAVARQNAERNGVDTRFLLSDLFSALPGEVFDLIVSNPPYVAEGAPEMSPEAMLYEPRAALYAGAEGMDVINEIVRQTPEHLARGGRLMMEIGYSQCDNILKLFAKSNSLIFERFVKDIYGTERVVIAVKIN